MKGGASRATDRDVARTSTRMTTIGERSVSFVDSEDEDSRATDEDLGYGDDREESTPATEAKPEPRAEAGLSAGSRGVARPLSRNLADERSAVVGPDATDDDWGEEEKEDEPSSKAVRDSDGLAVRPPVNGDTPAANKVLTRCFEKMQSSDWIRQFNPRQTRQSTWGDLRDELAYPVNSLNTTQVAEDTVSLLRAMGMDVRKYPSTLTFKEWSPSEAGADLHKWKKKLCTAFGVRDISKRRQPVSSVAVQAANPVMAPLPETPAKVDEGSRYFSDNAFSKGDESPYFQDSHTVTPRSASRARRLANDCDGSHVGRSAPRSSRGTRIRRSSNRHDGDSSDSDYAFWDQVDEDPRGGLVRQMDALRATATSDSGPRLELASHIPLDRIKRFSGRRNKSDTRCNG
ncbi:hypothetical protein PC129_g18062 [Phytophthora cactorum]|uniref:Eukaryotic/viral aspartic protease n=1 Tax=Phytophthora cactorum TaxID=29920 RepID=A0A8T1AGQ2_9STRA|nr:hypothetical protein Pcac1_g24948 [Phytophthora cactorum]KAG2793385.1 hypothetical protein PC111_g23058 [Phytophthora cactorum]KAG2806905.1 hypothetical protein PC112_g17636 [Phytophthora cactorum]KAG2815700.1 hypothetical protein PC113_g23181 [Phytophthora cactorum]KAG2873151.1 hypothetical protein PC114_g26002 [Phytophthora cactorum]